MTIEGYCWNSAYLKLKWTLNLSLSLLWHATIAEKNAQRSLDFLADIISLVNVIKVTILPNKISNFTNFKN